MTTNRPVGAEDTRAIWDAKAAFWDERMGDGSDFYRTAVGPAAESLLRLEPGERVLDIGCGNGVFSRRLAELDANVTATDFSPVFLDLARKRSEGTVNANRIR